MGSKRVKEFADMLIKLNAEIGFKISTRGWCYFIENKGMINKDQFDRVMNAIARCRKEGYLPVDFLADDENRMFKGVVEPSNRNGITIKDVIASNLNYVLEGSSGFIPDYWQDEEYYIQIVVEKIDLVTLFESVANDYRIPIANAKGWSSVYQRAEYARRFKEAEDMGLKCVLLYCGDYDPDGLRISDTIMSNLYDVKNVYFSDGFQGYDPSSLIIDRFGINYDFIMKHGFTWIDNLITGSGLDLSSAHHRNHHMPYVKEYINRVGVRKCESNAMINTISAAKQLVRDAIEKYLGKGASERFRQKRREANREYDRQLTASGLRNVIDDFLENN